MAPAKNGSFAFPEKAYGPGTSGFPATAIAGNLTTAGFLYDVSRHLDPTILLAMAIEISVANGPWSPLAGFTRPGGPNTGGPSGSTTGMEGFSVAFPNDPTANTRLRGTLTITGGSILTSGEVWWA